MTITESKLSGLFIIEPTVFEDQRGYFYESFNREEYQLHGISLEMVQDNQSLSQYGVIRGLHYQLNPHAQVKLVRVLEGTVWDVAVDLRQDSPTYGEWFGIELSASNKKQLLIPKGFAHGFAVTSPQAVFFYKCDQYYHPGSERGIHHADPQLQITWPIPDEKRIISNKDQALPLFNQAEHNFVIK